MAVGLPDVRSVAKSVMDKITGGYAAADEMPEDAEGSSEGIDVTEELKELSGMVHQGEVRSRRAEEIIQKLMSHGLSRDEAIAAAQDYGRSKDMGATDKADVVAPKVLIIKGQIVFPPGHPKARAKGDTPKAAPRAPVSKKGKPLSAKAAPRSPVGKLGRPLSAKASPRPAVTKGQVKGAKAAPRAPLKK